MTASPQRQQLAKAPVRPKYPNADGPIDFDTWHDCNLEAFMQRRMEEDCEELSQLWTQRIVSRAVCPKHFKTGKFLTLTFRKPKDLREQIARSLRYLVNYMRKFPDYKISAELGTTGNLHFHILLSSKCAREKQIHISNLLFRWKRSHGFTNIKEGGYFGYFIYMRKEDLLRNLRWNHTTLLLPTSIIIKSCAKFCMRLIKDHFLSALSLKKTNYTLTASSPRLFA